MEGKLLRLKNDIEFFQTTEPSRSTEILADLQDSSRKNSLGIMEWKNEKRNLGPMWGQGKLFPGRKFGYRH